MAFTRVSEIKPWIVDFLLTENPQTTGKKLHVLKYVSGPHEDGSIVKAATDLDVSIYVRFTAHALAVFTKTVDSESPDTHEEFNRAFIILKKYWSAHCPQSDKDSSRFEVVIDDFSLWMNETGLRLKVEPMPCMDVEEVREKSNRLWTEWKLRESSRRDSATDEEDNETGTSQNGGEPSMSSIHLSQLLDQMGVSSSTTADREKESVRGGAFTENQCLSLLGPSDLPVQLPENVDSSLIHISQDQQIQLNNIPEWKSGYRPPAVYYVSSSPSTENSAAKSSSAPQSSQAENSLSRPPLPDRPWRRTTTDNAFRVLGTLTTMESLDDQVATSDMGIGTYGIDIAIQVGDSMLGKSTGITRHTEIAAQVGDSLLNQHVSDSQSQYVSESQCDFQSQCAFDEVTKISHSGDYADSSSKSSLDSVIEVDPCNATQSQPMDIDRLDEGSCNNQITDTQGQRLVSSREESSGTSNSTGSKSKKSDSRTSRNKHISCDTNSDDDSFVTENSLDKRGLAADVGDYMPRVRLSCSESPETLQSFRKNPRRSASATSVEKEQNRKESKSIDDNSDNSLKLGQVQRLRSVNSSDGDHRRSPRHQQEVTPELSQVQRLRSEDSSDGDQRRSPRRQQVADPKPSKSIDDSSDNSLKLGQVQRLRSVNSSDGDHRRSPRLQDVAAPGKESPLSRSRKVAVLRDVSMQRSSPRNRQDTEENLAESEDIIMPTPPKVSRRKVYSPIRPLSTLSNQKKCASPLVDLKGTRSSLKTPVTFEGEVSVHQSFDDTPRNLDKQLQAVETSASAKAAASPGRVSRGGTEVSVSKHQEVVAETPSTGEEISPAKPDHISPRTTSDAITEETEIDETASRYVDKISRLPRNSARRSVMQGPYHSTQMSPETTRELPQLKLTLSPIKTPDSCRMDIRRKRESQGEMEARENICRSAGDTSPGTDSQSSQGSGTEESRSPSRESKTIDNEKTTVVSSLPKTTDSPRSSNRTSVEQTAPASPEKSTVNHQAPTNASKMVLCVSIERLELNKYKSSSSGSFNINDTDPVHQMEAPQKESQTITPGSNVGMRPKTKSQEPVHDISEDSAKRSTQRTVSDKTEGIEDIKEPTKSPHLSVTTSRVVGRTRRSEPQAPVNKDDSKEIKSPRLSVTHGRRIGRPRRSTPQEDSPVFVSRKEKLNVTRQSPCRTQVFKYSFSSSGSSSPNSEDDARTPARLRSKSSPRTPHIPQAAEQRRHTRNNSSNSSVSVNQFYRGSENSPRWRSLRVPVFKTPRSCKNKAQTERPGSHTRQRKFNVTRKSPRQSQVAEYSSSPTSGEDEQSDAPEAKTSTRTSKTPQKGPEAEDTRSVTTSTQRKVASCHIMKVPYEQSDDESSIVEIDDGAKTQSEDEDCEPRSPHNKKKLQDNTCERQPGSKRGRPRKSGTQPDTPNHQSESVGRLQKTTPQRTPRAFKPTQKAVANGDTCSTSSESVTTDVHRKVRQRHTRKNIIPTAAKVPDKPLNDEASAEEIDYGSSTEEIDDSEKTESYDEDYEPRSSHIKKKLQDDTCERQPGRKQGRPRKSGTQPDTPNHQSESVGLLQKTTPQRTPSSHIKKKLQGDACERQPGRKQGRPRKSGTQPDTPSHQSESVGQLQKTTPQRTPIMYKTPQKELLSEEDRPTMRVCVQRLPKPRHRMRLNRSDDETSVEEIDDGATTQSDDEIDYGSSIEEIDDSEKTQSDDEDYEPQSSHIKKKLQDDTCERQPGSKRGRPRKSGTQPDTPSHQSKSVGLLQKTTPQRTPSSHIKKKLQDDACERQPGSKQGRPRKSGTQPDTPNHQSESVGLLQKTTSQRTPIMYKTPQKELPYEEDRPTMRVCVQRLPEPRHRMRLNRSDDTSVEEIDNGATTQSDDEDWVLGSLGNKRKLKNKTPVPKRGKLLSEEDRPTLRVCVQRLPEPRHRMRLNRSDDTSVKEIDDGATTQSDDEDWVSGSLGNKSKLKNKTPVPKRGKLRKSESEVESPSEKQSEKQTPKGYKVSRKQLPSDAPCSASSQSVISSPHEKVRPSYTTKPTPSKSSQAAVKFSGDDTSIEEVDDEEEETQSGDEDYVPVSNGKGKKADSHKLVTKNRKRRHHEPSPQRHLGKSKRSAKSQKMGETEEDSEDEKVSDDEDFKPSPRKKIKALTRHRPTVRQKRLNSTKESSDEASEDEANKQDEDYNPSKYEKDEEYNPSPGTKLHLPLDRKSTRRYQDRTKLSLAKKPAAQSRKTKAKKRMNVQLAESGRIEIIQENTVPHNLSALFSASKKPATSKLKPSISRKRKLFSEQTLLGEPLPEVQEESEKPAKGGNLRLKMASPLKPLLPKLSGRRQVYDVSDDSDIVAQASDKSSSSIANDESTLHESSETQEKGTTKNTNSPSLDNVVEEEGEPFSMTTPVSSLPSHQPVTMDSSPEESLDGSVLQQKEDIATAADQEATTAAVEQGNLNDLEANQTKASSSPRKGRFSVSTPASSLPSHQPEQREEPASLKDTPIREEIQHILSTLPKDPPVGASSPLTDVDMPPDLITRLSNYFADDEFA